ncbi:hypothetical protein SAMN05216466_102389 [Paraburkholderia phenazinium]|uniref:Uncharacterized protein n=1 Tax=Paraburkholderia phenazinium TaxID=60549 RepID=A0A1G7S5A5_9BURK|nr:hypothetical protein SAMN05216466_102389 [Paraburkholderia phenazinium]
MCSGSETLGAAPALIEPPGASKLSAQQAFEPTWHGRCNTTVTHLFAASDL